MQLKTSMLDSNMGAMEVSINWIGVLVAAVSAFIIGAVWYGPLFGKTWQKLVGLSDKETQKNMTRTLVGAFVLTFIVSVVLAYFIGANDIAFGLFAGLAAGLGWVATAFGINYLFEHRSFKLYLINAGYNIIIFGLTGAIIGAF